MPPLPKELHCGSFNNFSSTILFQNTAPADLATNVPYAADRVLVPDVGSYLEEWRGSIGKRRLAQNADLHRHTIANMEAGSRRSRFATIEKAYRAIGGGTLLLAVSTPGCDENGETTMLVADQNGQAAMKTWFVKLRDSCITRNEAAKRARVTYNSLQTFERHPTSSSATFSLLASRILGLRVDFLCVQKFQE